MELLLSIRDYLARTGLSATRFGQEAVGDPRLVHDMRRGRQLRPATARRVVAFMAGDRA